MTRFTLISRILLLLAILGFLCLSLQAGCIGASAVEAAGQRYHALTGRWTLHLVSSTQAQPGMGPSEGSTLSSTPCAVSVTFTPTSDETNGVRAHFTIPASTHNEREREDSSVHSSSSCPFHMAGEYSLALHDLDPAEEDVVYAEGEQVGGTKPSERRLLRVDIASTSPLGKGLDTLRLMLHAHVHSSPRPSTSTSAARDVVSIVASSLPQSHHASFALVTPRLWFLAVELVGDSTSSLTPSSSQRPTMHTLHIVGQKEVATEVPPEGAWYQQTPFLMLLVVLMTVLRGYFAYRRESERMARRQQQAGTTSASSQAKIAQSKKKKN